MVHIAEKFDIILRDERIRYQYQYLHECLKMKPKDAIALLVDTPIITWSGKSYYLTRRSMEHIIYDRKLNVITKSTATKVTSKN